MKASRRSLSQKVLVGLFIAIVGLVPAVQTATDRSFVDATPMEMLLRGLIWGTVVIAPAIGYLLGVRWCRYLFSAFALIALLGWSFSPLAQHAIDRHLAFWCIWTLIEVLLVALVWTVLAGPKEPNKAPEPT